MKTVCVYHSIDLDGWMSAAIVKHWFINKSKFIDLERDGNIGDELDFIGYNYGQPIPDLSEYDKVIMCDISFPPGIMYKLSQNININDNLIWIDHHLSAINDSYTNNYNRCVGLRDTKFAACELTWFYMNNPIENSIVDLTLFNRYKEEWVEIDDIYSISNYGRILSKERVVNHVGGVAYRPNKILKHIVDSNGYVRVTLNNKSELVHKLVAKYFLDGSGETINHIDGNKENNCFSNLEYSTYQENNQHAIDNNLRRKGEEHWQSKSVEQYKDDILIKTFGSTTEASKELGISQGNIAAVCRYYNGEKSKFRNRTQAGGFVFKYKDEVKEEKRFDRHDLKRIVNIGSILSQSQSIILDTTEKEVHNFFNTPEIVRLLGRYDCFGHKQTDEEQKVLEFQYGARQCISNYEEAYNYLHNCLLQIEPNIIENSIWLNGKGIYQYLCTEAKQAYKNGFEIMFYWAEPKDYGNINNPKQCSAKFICINKERFNPINFGIDYHSEGYDGCACFHYDGVANLWRFSLYNDNGEVDCSIIAKDFGGGGHRGASGFVVKDINNFFENCKIK